MDVQRGWYREWRRRRAWRHLYGVGEPESWVAARLEPMEQYRWNMRGEWLRRRVEKFGKPRDLDA